MKTRLFGFVDHILVPRPAAPRRGGRGPQRPLAAVWAGVLLLLLGGGFTGARAQVISDPNQITGTIRWNNSPGPVLAFLMTAGFVTLPNSCFIAADEVSSGPNHATTLFTAATRVSTPYVITVQAADSPGIRYDVSPTVGVINGNYTFATATSAGVLKELEPDVPLDFIECAGLIRIHYRDAAGTPVPVDSSGIYAYIQASGARQALGGFPQNTGVTDHTLIVRSETVLNLFVSADVHLGTDRFLDYISFYTSSNYVVTVPCNGIVDVTLIIPPIDGSSGDTLGSITGRVDMLREEEHWTSRGTTLMHAFHGPQGNERFFTVGLLTQPDYLPCPGPSPTAGTTAGALACNSAGPYALAKMLPSNFQSLNQDYGVRAITYFRKNCAFETFVSPTLTGVTVPAGGSVNLGDTFVINPGYVAGDIFLCGPDITNSPLRNLIRNCDNLNPNGIPSYTGFEYSSSVRAVGQNTLGPGATFTANGGEAYTSFDGGFVTSGPDQNHWVGSYNLVLGGLGGPVGQTTFWDQKLLALYLFSTPPIPTADRDNFIYSRINIYNHHFAKQEIIPGQTNTAHHRYAGSQVCITFHANSGTLFSPRVTGAGTFNGTFETIPTDYGVDVGLSYGTPGDIGTATSDGQVVLYLPQGHYTLNPTVESVDPAGSSSTHNSLAPFTLEVPPCSYIKVTPCVQMSISVPECPRTNLLHVTGSVNSCTNITSISYVLNGVLPPVPVCNNCGISPTFAFDITLNPCKNTLKVIATAANGDVSSVESTIDYDVTPPVLTGCANLSTNSLDGTNGNFVSYTLPTAQDYCDGPLPVTCVPPSGSFFTEGSTVVTCTAWDHCRNTNTCQFTVEIRSEGCLRIGNTNVVCVTNVPGSYRYSFTAQNLSPSAVKYLFVVPEPDCFTTSPSFFTFTPPLEPGQSANVSLALNNLQPACGDRLCFIFSLHNSNFLFCCAVTNCIPNPAFIDLDCPTNLTVIALGNSMVVDYPAPIVTGGVLAGCTPPSGSVFPLGATVVTCTATNACGSSNICTFTVTVTNCSCSVTTNAPTNDTPAWATQLITAPATVSGCLQNAGPTPQGVAGLFPPVGPASPSLLSQEHAKDVWFSFTPTVDGNVTVDTCGPATCPTDTVLAVYWGRPEALLMNPPGVVGQKWFNNNMSPACSDNAGAAKVMFKARACTTYYLRVSARHVDILPGDFTLNLTQTPVLPANDVCDNFIPVSPNSSTPFNNKLAHTEGTGLASDNDIWFRFKAPGNGLTTVETCTADFPSALAVYTGQNCNTLTLVPGTSASCGQGATFTFTATANQVYRVRIGGANSTARGCGFLHISSAIPALGTLPSAGRPKYRKYAIVGLPTGVAWSWSLTSPDLGCGGLNIEGTVAGVTSGGAIALARDFRDSINNPANAPISATALEANPARPEVAYLKICTPCPTNKVILKVGPAGTPNCWVENLALLVAVPPCNFNPIIYEIADPDDSDTDCNGNGQSDYLDITDGTSLDLDGNGVPDECETGLSITYNALGHEAVISWGATDAILEQSANLTGPWSEVIGATSPHTVAPATGTTNRFFRLRRN